MKKRPAPAIPSIEAVALEAGAPRKRVRAADVEMMLAEVYPHPFSRPGWIYEIKLDGYRLVAGRSGSKVTVLSRNGNELGDAFPGIVTAMVVTIAARDCN